MNQIRTSLLLGLTLLTPLSSWSACNIVNGKAYGDCENVLVHQGARPALKIRNHVTESGIVSGATVYADGSLNFSGIANGDITVNKGGRLSVTGVVNATVRNNGGFVEIEGIIDSLISNGGNAVISGQVGSFSGKGPVIFNKGSVLQGKPIDKRLSLPAVSHSGRSDQQR